MNDVNAVFSVHPETLRLLAYVCFYAMVLVAILVTKTSVDVDFNSTVLMRTFGYNNICVYWDYSPAKEVASLIFPLAEYLFQGYLVFGLLQVYESMLAGDVTPLFFRVRCAMTPLEMLLIAWVRLIFVIDGETNIKGHTAGFLCLQVAILAIAFQNFMYHHALNLMPLSRQLGARTATAFSVAYLFVLIVATIAKMTITLSIFAGSPVINTKTVDGSKIAQAFDMLWMLCGAVIPGIAAWGQRGATPPVVVLGSLPTVYKQAPESESESTESGELSSLQSDPPSRGAQVSI